MNEDAESLREGSHQAMAFKENDSRSCCRQGYYHIIEVRKR
jgi:hypothetical protein